MTPGIRPVAACALYAIALSCNAPAAVAQETEPRGAWSGILRSLGLQSPPGPRGNEAYRDGEYERAVEEYARAHDESPDPRLAHNTGSALYRQGLYPEAAAAYRFALQGAGDDSAFTARVHYNLGNAFARKAESASGGDGTMADLREALAHYRKSLLLRPGHRDVQKNLELVHANLQRLMEQREREDPPAGDPPETPDPGEQAKEALARALQLAQERRYAEARAVLDDVLRRDRTAAPYEAHRNRIDDVMKILEGGEPPPPFPRDPRVRPGAAEK